MKDAAKDAATFPKSNEPYRAAAQHLISTHDDTHLDRSLSTLPPLVRQICSTGGCTYLCAVPRMRRSCCVTAAKFGRCGLRFKMCEGSLCVGQPLLPQIRPAGIYYILTQVSILDYCGCSIRLGPASIYYHSL